MELSDCMIEEFRTEHQKYGMRITHIPTGHAVEGNCGWIDKIDEVRSILLARLGDSIKDAPLLSPEKRKKRDKREEIIEECAKLVESNNAKAIARLVRELK